MEDITFFCTMITNITMQTEKIYNLFFCGER